MKLQSGRTNESITEIEIENRHSMPMPDKVFYWEGVNRYGRTFYGKSAKSIAEKQ